MLFLGPLCNELDMQLSKCCFRVYVYFQIDITYSREKHFLFLKKDLATRIYFSSISLLFCKMYI